MCVCERERDGGREREGERQRRGERGGGERRGGEREGAVQGDGLGRVLVKDVRLEGGTLVCGIFEWYLLHMV